MPSQHLWRASGRAALKPPQMAERCRTRSGANTPLQTWAKVATVTLALRLKARASVAKNFLDRLKKWPRILRALRP
jgi:hypothetical protein